MTVATKWRIMRPSNQQRRWTDPLLPMDPAYHRLSFVLFQTDEDAGRVVASRVPEEGFLSPGSYIQDQLRLSEEAMRYINGDCEEPPLFILTEKGLGVLLKRYVLSAGLVLLLHIHTKPASAARILNSGGLGQGSIEGFSVSLRIAEQTGRVTSRDESSYRPLWEAWQAVQGQTEPIFKTDEADTLSLGEIREGILRLAAFVGCDVTFTYRKSEGSRGFFSCERVKCYRPLLLEALLLCLLAEIRSCSATGRGICCLESPTERGRDGLALSLRYPVSPAEDGDTAWCIDRLHSHWTGIADLGGLDVYAPPTLLYSSKTEGLPERVVWLDWLTDPSVLTSSDLKVGIRLRLEERKQYGLSGEEVELP